MPVLAPAIEVRCGVSMTETSDAVERYATNLRIVYISHLDARQPFVTEVGPAIQVDGRNDLHVRETVPHAARQ